MKHAIKHFVACLADRISTRFWVRVPESNQLASFEEMEAVALSLRDFLLRDSLIGAGVCSRGPIIYEWMSVIYGRDKTWKYWQWCVQQEYLAEAAEATPSI
jgi:hypothetical protein